MDPTIKTFVDNPAVAEAFAKDFVALLKTLTAKQAKVTVALSGGSTPKLLFAVLADQYADQVNWAKVHFFWGDERCVAPADAESNYGAAEKLLLSKVSIPRENIHRVMGESNPELEQIRYSDEVVEHVKGNDAGVPSFDIMLLGMGSDGHTASIFPHQMELLTADETCRIATHPESGQQRITLTGKVLDASRIVFFLVTGESKATVLAEIINQTGQFKSYPTSHINPSQGSTFYIDQSASSKL